MNLFEFYVDGDKFYDVRIKELALIDPVLELTVNNAGTFTFTIPPEHPKYDSFKPLKSTIEIFRDGEWFWEGRVVDYDKDFLTRKNITVEGALAYLNDSVQGQWEYTGTPEGYIEHVLGVHNSQVAENRKIYLGQVTVRDPNNYMYCFTNYNSTLQELKEDIVDDLGGFLRVRKTGGKLYLDAIEDYGRTCSQVIQLGSNLIDLAPSFDYKDIASVIIPLGATLEDQETHEEGLEALDKYVEITEVNDGKNYLGREDLIENFDKIWKKVSFPNIHTPQGLLEKAKKYLTDGQWGEMVIEAKAFDLNYTSEEFQEFRLGDRVRVKSDLHGIDRYFPLTSQTFHFNDVAQNTITLGGTGEPISITGVTNEVTLSNERLDERIKDPNRLIQQAIWDATQQITQGLNGYVRVDGNEILIMDTDDPATAKHVWRWNMGGLGYSNNGYLGPFETAITMDGTIVGKFLAANSVAAEQIDVNYTSHVEKQCNDYTDEKLGSYWTYAETTTYFQTLADQINAGVKTTLKGYVTNQTLESKLQITESNITTTVTNNFNKTLDNYSTTREMNSAIEQKADSITSTVTSNFNEKLKDYSTTKQMNSAIEQKANSITSTVTESFNEKLKSYSTTTKVQSMIDQKADSITSSVTSTFNKKLSDNYYTSSKVDSLIDQKADSITSSVTRTLNNTLGSYSTTSQVKSLIQQTADSITASLSSYVTDYEFTELEQKITTDGIFTTINDGIKGNKSIVNTYFSMDRNGLTIQNGGITVKNRNGSTVMSVDTSGNLNVSGNFTTRLNSTSGWEIKGDYIYHYYNNSQTLTIAGGTVNKDNCTEIKAINRPLVFTAQCGMKMVFDNEGIKIDPSSGRGHLYINQGGINYMGYSGGVDNSTDRWHAQFLNGILYQVTYY